MIEQQYKNLNLTILVGLGGTGAEVLSRVRHLIEDNLNYKDIKQKFLLACDRIKDYENYMLDRYGIKVNSDRVNVFVVISCQLQQP